LGGADTVATANPLAHATRKICTELLGGSNDYFIVSGMQSVDGDTAQVPAQMAEELDIPCIPYATEAEFKDGHFEFTRVICGGSQVVKTLSTPAIVTVAKYEHPLFASFALTRKGNQMELVQWSAADGSKTRVIRVFPPGKTTRKCQQVSSATELAKIIKENLASESDDQAGGGEKQPHYILPDKRDNKFDRHYEGTVKEVDDFKVLAAKLKDLNITDIATVNDEAKEKILGDEAISFHKKALDDMLAGMTQTTPEYTGEVWVMAEHADGEINAATFELIGKARDLADSLCTHVGVVLVGDNVKSMTDGLIAGGADKIYTIEDPLLKDFDPHSYRKAVADVVKKYQPQIILYGATPQGRVLAPMVSYRVGCGLTADCTGLDIRDSSRKGQVAVLMQTRPALGGNVMATICTKDSTCQMATARPGVMKRLDADESRKGEIIEHTLEITQDDLSLEIISTEKGGGSVNFDSEVIISGGKGMQSRDAYIKLLEDLCGTVGEKFDVTVERGASRTAIEQGFTERIYQVGQTGTAVGPKLYVAVGISGAIQHMIGVANTETIIAVNTDPNAPIFTQCDYYIIGGAEKVIPELIEALKAS
jgi:electron transfer flavoprotein alpha subunit